MSEIHFKPLLNDPNLAMKIEDRLYFLPENQQAFLKNLIDKALDNQALLQGVEKICSVIHLVEVALPTKGEEILKGAHLIIMDKGQLAQNIKDETSNQTRFSSHHHASKIIEFGVDIHPTHELLVGQTNDYTFWQLERTKVRNWYDMLNNVKHLYDYFEYKITGQNIGPIGSSQHTESHPLVINFDADQLESDLFSL